MTKIRKKSGFEKGPYFGQKTFFFPQNNAHLTKKIGLASRFHKKHALLKKRKKRKKTGFEK